MNIGTLHKGEADFAVRYYSTFTDKVETYPLHEDSIESAMETAVNGQSVVFEVVDHKARLVSNEKAASLYFNMGS